jgi:hypothetical protein
MNSNCTHHWQIDPANGPTSAGRCKLCGAKANFANYLKGAGEHGEGWERKIISPEPYGYYPPTAFPYHLGDQFKSWV